MSIWRTDGITGQSSIAPSRSFEPATALPRLAREEERMHKNEKTLQQILDVGLPVVERTLGEARSALLRPKAEARLAALEPDAPDFRDRVNRTLFELGVPVLALYLTLRDDLGLDQEPALRLLEE